MSVADAVEPQSEDIVGDIVNAQTTRPSADDQLITPDRGVEAKTDEVSSAQKLEGHDQIIEGMLQPQEPSDVLVVEDTQVEAANKEIASLETTSITVESRSEVTEAQNGRPLTPNIPTITIEHATPVVLPNSISDTEEPIPSKAPLERKKILSSSSLYFVKKTMDIIASSREGKKKGQLKDLAQKVNEMVQTSAQNGVDPNVIFEPLRLCCLSQSVILTTQALDCIGKLIAVSFFDAPPPSIPAPIDADEDNVVPAHRADAPTRPLMDRVIDTICDCFQGEGTDEKVQLQIIKALLSAVLDEQEGTMIHQSPLLKAIRQTYNIFLLSRSTPTQSIAQGTLEQMVHAVFGRVKINATAGTPNGSTDDLRTTLRNSLVRRKTDEDPKVAGDQSPQEKVTLDSFARRQSFDQIPETNADSSLILSHDEILVKDAFLIFRSMCKLSTKTLAVDSIGDLKSHMVRSKLLSLHMIATILNRHMAIFLSPQVMIRSSATSQGIQFIQATKQYLCYALSRNAVSHIPQVFNVSCDIFWRMIDSLRGYLKKEIEVFMIEIYLPILEMRTSSYQQKLSFINVLSRLCSDPRALVEVYLNYDCDRGAMDNIYERIMNDLTKITATQVQLNVTQQQWQNRNNESSDPVSNRDHNRTPSLSTRNISGRAMDADMMPEEYQLKQVAMRCLISVLRSLIQWCESGMAMARQEADEDVQDEERPSEDLNRKPAPVKPYSPSTSVPGDVASRRRGITLSSEGVTSEDDPAEFENLKHRKTALIEAVKLFNFKPKKGVQALLRQGFLRDSDPKTIATFLLRTEGLNKATIGEYLGEGDAENVKIMHEFVDMLEFEGTKFVEALRRLLQTFRLPGEAQKIDRFMLKFAERYVSGNPGFFANADTAYILAFSVIMLNTDAHSTTLAKQKRMSKEDFLKNNRGIDDGKDLDSAFLEDVYNEIQTHEIVLKEEQDAALLNSVPTAAGQSFTANISSALATVGRDLQREAYVAASKEMANKSEARFKNLLKAQKKSSIRRSGSVFYSASHFEHVGPMFEVIWMPMLASLSGPLQMSDDIDTIANCLTGFKHSIRIVCLFDLSLARNAFVRTLAWFTSLNSIQDMKPKNILGVRALLEIALSEGNELKDSWKDVLTAVSQLERLQLLSSGIEEDMVPDMSKVQSRASQDTARSRSSFQATRNALKRTTSYSEAVAIEARSREITVAIDRIFTQSATLSGTAIMDFVKALSEVSAEEINSTANTDAPRMYSLQKVVEISYYNMARVRFEWSNIWIVLGAHFNEVGCNQNASIAFFALDALRQLSSRFLEIDELPHFKFQKDFLRPFEYILANNPILAIKDMVLQCLNQMIQARADNIKSGWQTMFGVFTFAAKEPYEQIVNIAFENVRHIYRDRLGVVLSQGSFPNLISCLTVLAKNHRFQRISLQSLEALKSTERAMLTSSQCPLSKNYTGEDSSENDPLVRYWFPILYGFHDILMSGEDMEVRSRALQCLFEALTEYGDTFTPEFWDIICRQLLFPIFFVLRSDKEGPKLNNMEDLTIWLSTTMVEALRNLIQLYSTFFSRLEHMLIGYLDLLSSCICQENDTLARIGTACLQQLVIENASNFEEKHWKEVVKTFQYLFRTTTAEQLFSQGQEPQEETFDGIRTSVFDTTSAPTLSDNASLAEAGTANPNSSGSVAVPVGKKKEFKALIVKCVLQLLLIEALSELLIKNKQVYEAAPVKEVCELLEVLKQSWLFAKRFNADRELRISLWKMGFMKQLPNLLRQEVASASGYINVSLQLYGDRRMQTLQDEQISAQVIPTCEDLLVEFTRLDEANARNVSAWRPVICDIFRAYTSFGREEFLLHLDIFYVQATEILRMENVDGELRKCLEMLFKRAGELVIFSKTKGKQKV
ncbi:putative Guanyl-nucleotide exchange factor [Taphrina deformans PYCC 5710]|uniref:Guanyl-nucleotide exchange factor n=1 Tax=Taphrina deformans (strain PYCC 5710 / ATCC 11124 / CBS 356.35 / IMI 108563 / JCM 9778 / NBRC 8474) TaxID=1097556 RepID=R4X6G5_TAPDE|nr:putative Guanyl-nucleotide exchange factor [Taphrina deformans PYCC 5710]|eukprot:CCG80699.1 putative Guanyl-nucleotide exchange factor [Taphrina deformans PYCC 5710]